MNNDRGSVMAAFMGGLVGFLVGLFFALTVVAPTVLLRHATDNVLSAPEEVRKIVDTPTLTKEQKWLLLRRFLEYGGKEDR